MELKGGHNNATSFALLEQLVYIDNFINNGNSTTGSTGEMTPNLDIDGQLSMDLAAFADDSFIFPDEEKRDDSSNGNDNDIGNDKDEFAESIARQKTDQPSFSMLPSNGGPKSHNISEGSPIISSEVNDIGLENSNHMSDISDNSKTATNEADDIKVSSLPKFPVPPGAKSSLESAGLTSSQIDLLSALIAQHQNNLKFRDEPEGASNGTVRQHNELMFDENRELDHDLMSLHDMAGSTRSLSTISNSSNDTPGASTSFKQDFSSPTGLDKRKRNTAASARFRIKKKLKERQMEEKISHLGNLIKDFESKISQLEMENKLLKNLIIEKGSKQSDDELKLMKEKARFGQ